FRFDTPWFYLLKGFNDEGDEADFVKLAVTVKQVEATYIYYGILEDFYLTDSEISTASFYPPWSDAN
ncbi:MAG: hypothetical protein JAY73_16050, partial [Candidatus Thiodiazotropha taylori]|nr:hypothetical protein [Candidatus Thiodiazotropha taylori]